MSRCSQRVEGVQFGNPSIGSLLFAVRDFQVHMDQFSPECEVTGMRISTYKCEAMVEKFIYLVHE